MKFKNMLIIGLLFLAVIFSAGCADNKSIDTGATQSHEASVTEQNQATLLKSTPPPQLTNSLERENLKNRLLFLNKANQLFYVALLSNDGKILATYVTHKVSSVNSLLTTPDQIVPDPFSSTGNNHGIIVASPDLDGSYGTNGNAIFFFTTDGAYIEWSGLYLESSQPFVLNTPPILTKQT
jgi:hypothetical protein